MKNKYLILFFCFITCFLYTAVNGLVKGEGWLAGVSKVVITPQFSMWMAGYDSRDRPSEGKIHDLWAKALILQDSSGNKGVIISTDIETFPKSNSDNIRDILKNKYGLSKSQILINCSHTHSGPVLDGMYNVYTDDSAQIAKISAYSSWFEDKIINLVASALDSMVPVKIYSGNGTTRFQVNRRNNKEALLTPVTELNGPNDYSVPVLKVVKESGNILAILFGYACHANNWGQYKFSGDYPGFAQIELENTYPDATALFLQGAGGDQNPLPRRSMSNGKLTGSIAFAQQYGCELAAAVDRVLSEDMYKLSPTLSVSYSEIELPLETPPSKEELLRVLSEGNKQKKLWASRLLDKIENGETLISSYPFPSQVWKLGKQTIVTLGGEPVIEYSIEMKKMFGQDIFVFGYSNFAMSYIPSSKIIQEGGYEGESSQIIYGFPSKWKTSIETLILEELKRLAESINVPLIN